MQQIVIHAHVIGNETKTIVSTYSEVTIGMWSARHKKKYVSCPTYEGN